MYVDNLVTVVNTLDEVTNVKKECAELFQKGNFILHQWNSNIPVLKSDNVDAESEMTNASQIFNPGESEAKIISLDWKKTSDKISVITPPRKEKKATKI